MVGTNHFMPEKRASVFPQTPLARHDVGFVETVPQRLQIAWTVFLPRPGRASTSLREAGLTAPAKVISNGIDLRRFSGMTSAGVYLRVRAGPYLRKVRHPPGCPPRSWPWGGWTKTRR